MASFEVDWTGASRPFFFPVHRSLFSTDCNGYRTPAVALIRNHAPNSFCHNVVPAG